MIKYLFILALLFVSCYAQITYKYNVGDIVCHKLNMNQKIIILERGTRYRIGDNDLPAYRTRISPLKQSFFFEETELCDCKNLK
jgi:hypothetical protein